MKLNLGKNKIITLKAYGLKIKIQCKFRVILIHLDNLKMIISEPRMLNLDSTNVNGSIHYLYPINQWSFYHT
jgi:hypothetical protein